MSEKWYVGIDVGGTTVKMAFISQEGDLLKKWEIPTNTSDGGKQIPTDIAQSITEKLDELNEPSNRLLAIGMGAPGFIEMETGYIYLAVNIGWRDFHLRELLETETNLPVVVDNDANIAALGEMWRGAGGEAENILFVTLGTGVGGGIVANGQILHGANGMAGEIGHITSIPEGGAPCNCGKTGCLETIASATGIVRTATEGLKAHPDSSLQAIYLKNGALTAKDVFEAVNAGDAWAQQVLDHTAFYLGLALANLSNSINPDKIVIGGGVSKAGNALIEPLVKHFNTFALERVAEGTEFKIATLGNDAGVIGGAWLAKQKHS